MRNVSCMLSLSVVAKLVCSGVCRIVQCSPSPPLPTMDLPGIFTHKVRLYNHSGTFTPLQLQASYKFMKVQALYGSPFPVKPPYLATFAGMTILSGHLRLQPIYENARGMQNHYCVCLHFARIQHDFWSIAGQRLRIQNACCLVLCFLCAYWHVWIFCLHRVGHVAFF